MTKVGVLLQKLIIGKRTFPRNGCNVRRQERNRIHSKSGSAKDTDRRKHRKNRQSQHTQGCYQQRILQARKNADIQHIT